MNPFVEMRALIAVIDAGSFVGAAETLGQSTTAVSRWVGQLEERLGVRLLQRTTRRISVTSEGLAFSSRAREILAALEEAETEAETRRADPAGRLRINAPVTYGIRHLAPLWPAFKRKHPRIELDVVLSDRTVDLIDDGFDIAIRIAQLPNSSLISRELARTHMLLCASPEYLARHGAPQTPAELTAHAAIAYSYWSDGDEWCFDGPNGEIRVRIRPWMHSNNGDTCREAALRGEGVILQPDFLIGEDVLAGRLVRLCPAYRSLDLGIYALYPTRKHIPAKLRALVDFLAERLTAPGPS
jgi:DNA-binding transcriptional LysR family regulator